MVTHVDLCSHEIKFGNLLFSLLLDDATTENSGLGGHSRIYFKYASCCLLDYFLMSIIYEQVVLVPAMSDYSSMLRSYWMMEEEDDDMHFLLDDDEAEVATYNLLVEAESSHTRRRSDAPPKVIRPRDLPSGHNRIKSDYFIPNPVYNDKQFRRRYRCAYFE